MNTRTSKGFISRTGYALGATARFIVFNSQPARCWGKRLVLFALASPALYFSFSWMVGVILSLICIILISLAISKMDIVRLNKSSDTPATPHDQDVFDYKLD